MSLINDMLRDLDAKRPDDPARLNLQREIRSLPAAKGRAAPWRLALLAGLPALGVAAAWLHANERLLPLLGVMPPANSALVPTIAPPALVPPIAAVPELRPARSLAYSPPAETLLPVPDPQAAKPSVPTAGGERPPASAAMAKVDQPGAAKPPPPQPVLAQPIAQPVVAQPPAPVAAPARIEKVPMAATPRDRAEAEFQRAETALAGGRASEAADALRGALKQDPSHVAARQLLLRQLLELRKVGEVVALLQEGLQQLPDQTGWAMSLARLQLERGDPAAADATLARSASFAEASADYAGFMGHLKTRLGEPRQAIPLYARATRLAPDEGRWWLGLGLAQEADGRLADARESLRHALATGRLSRELAAVAEQHLR